MLTHYLLGLPLWWLLPALGLALAVDRWWGEPPLRWHPVVWMGNYLGWAGRHLQALARPWPLSAPSPLQPERVHGGGAEGRAWQPPSGADWRAFWAGALAWWLGVAWALAGALALMQAVSQGMSALQGSAAAQGVAVLLLGLALKPLLAWAMLRSEVSAVEQALSGSLEAGRERLSWLVSRDVSALSESGVRESALESLAENLSDSVVAPLFWFVLLGLPGAAVYRLANTADAMWGYRGVYRGKTWEWAGKWAARADDVLNWIPARVTAVALCWAAPARPGAAARPRWSQLAQEAARTPSPNSGWPMAALALSLGLALRKPGVYVLNAAGQAPAAAATLQAVALCRRALVWTVAAMAAAVLAVAATPALVAGAPWGAVA